MEGWPVKESKIHTLIDTYTLSDNLLCEKSRIEYNYKSPHEVSNLLLLKENLSVCSFLRECGSAAGNDFAPA